MKATSHANPGVPEIIFPSREGGEPQDPPQIIDPLTGEKEKIFSLIDGIVCEVPSSPKTGSKEEKKPENLANHENARLTTFIENESHRSFLEDSGQPSLEEWVQRLVEAVRINKQFEIKEYGFYSSTELQLWLGDQGHPNPAGFFRHLIDNGVLFRHPVKPELIRFERI